MYATSSAVASTVTPSPSARLTYMPGPMCTTCPPARAAAHAPDPGSIAASAWASAAPWRAGPVSMRATRARSTTSTARQGLHDRDLVGRRDARRQVTHRVRVDEDLHVLPQMAAFVHDAEAQARVATVELREHGVEVVRVDVDDRLLVGVRPQRRRDPHLHAVPAGAHSTE